MKKVGIQPKKYISLLKSKFTKEGFQARALSQTKPLHPRVILEGRKNNTDGKITLTDVMHSDRGCNS